MIDRITKLFLQYLKSCSVSEKTYRNYKSDLALFSAWLIFKAKAIGADCQNLQEALPFISKKTANEYKEFLLANKTPAPTLNRRLSTLRIFSKFLYENQFISFDFAQGVKNISKAHDLSPFEKDVKEFSFFLESQKASPLTIKNYLSDISQFLKWIEKTGKKEINQIISKDIKRYLIIELSHAPQNTKDRKVASFKKFFSWALSEKKININPVEKYLKETAYIKPIEQSLSEISEKNIQRSVLGIYPSYQPWRERITAYLADKPKLQRIVYNLLYNRPKWYITYHSLAFTRYLHLAILIVFAAALGFGAYQQFFAKTQTPIAYPTQPTPPKRYLSFQGRLTNQYNTPITTATQVVFKLYDASTGGNTLWNSTGVPCTITPDQDGIFSILLGTESGEGYTCTGISAISASVFSENPEVWLGVKVGSDAEATPRIQIATVAYALNAETLQGYPIDATGSATKNTVLTMNAGGEVVLAEVGPKIKSVSGNFAIQGEAITLQANGGSVAGDIILSPASDGTVSILASGTTNDSLYIQNAQITSGALIHGYYGGTATDVALLKLGSGVTESTKFLVESSGDTFLASGADLFIGGIGLNDNTSTSSGASLIGLYDDSMTYISGNTNVQDAIKQLDTAIGSLTGSAGGWTDDGTVVRLTTITDRVGIGTTSPHANTKLGVLGGVAIGSQTFSDAQAPTNGLIVEGNVGIGTTNPSTKLYVAGFTTIENQLNIAGTWAQIQAIDGNANLEIKTTAGTGNLILSTNNTEAMRITHTGNIGIGTTAPSYKLHVNGSFYATQTITSYDNVITVDRNGGGDYTTINQAITAINNAGDASYSNPYIIWIMAGIYDEDVNVPSYVSLKGQGFPTTRIDGRVTLSGHGSHIENLFIYPTGSENIALHVTENNSSTSINFVYNVYIAIDYSVDGPVYAVYNESNNDLRIYNSFVYPRNSNSGTNAKAVNYYSNVTYGTTAGDIEAHNTHHKTSCPTNSNCILAVNDSTVSGSDIIVQGTWSVFNDTSPVGAQNNGNGQIKLALLYENDASDYAMYTTSGNNVVIEPTKTGNIDVQLGNGFTSGNAFNMSFVNSTTLAGALNGLNIDLSTNIVSGNYQVKGINLNIPDSGTSLSYGIYSSGEDANYFSGNLGIGTTAPGAKLDVNGNLRLTTGTLQIGNAANQTYNRIGTSATNRGMSAANDVLISGKLEVDQAFFPDSGIYGSSGGLVVSFPNNNAWFTNEVWIDGKLGIGTTNPANKLSVIGGVNIGSTSYNVTAPTNGMIVEGNVGIGTTNPTRALHVYKNSNSFEFIEFINNNNGDSAAAAFGVHNGTEGFSFGKLGVNNTYYTGYGGPGDSFIYSGAAGVNLNIINAYSSGSIYFFAGGTASSSVDLSIKSDGNVGIGTINPVTRLDVPAATSISNNAITIRSGYYRGYNRTIGSTTGSVVEIIGNQATATGEPAGGFGMVVAGNQASPIVWMYGNENNAFEVIHKTWAGSLQTDPTLFTVRSSGNVGIGTTAPNYKFTIAGGSTIFGVDNTATFAAKNSSGNYENYLWPRWSDNIMYLNYGSGGFNIRNNSSTSTIFMTNDNKVGIGTTAPEYKLDITDRIRVRQGTAGTAGIWLYQTTPASDRAFIGMASDNRVGFWGGTGAGWGLVMDTTSGNVGIGTTSPGSLLTVNGIIRQTATADSNKYTLLDTFQGMQNETFLSIDPITSTNTLNSVVRFFRKVNTTGLTKIDIFKGDNTLTLNSQLGGNTDTLLNINTGKVGIGTAAPDNLLDITKNFGSNYIMRIRNYYNGPNRRQLVIYQGGTSTPATTDVYIAFSNDVNWGFNGSITGNGSGGVRYNTTSDKRLKTNLKYVNDALDIINKITPYYFDFIFAPGKTNIGFMAQDLIDIYPYAVSGNPNSDPLTNPMQIDYSKFTPLLLAGIKEQQNQINILKDSLQNLSLTSTGDLNIAQNQAGEYQVQKADGSVVDQLAAFAEVVIGKIKAGLVEAQRITTDKLEATTALVDNMLIRVGLVSPSVKTANISPLDGEKDIKVNLTEEGSLSIQNQNQEEVASIDVEGNIKANSVEVDSANLQNASVSGELTANKLSSDEVIAQKIYADQIVAKDGAILDISTANLSGVTMEQIEALLREAETDQRLLQMASDWNIETASQSAKLANIETANIQNLFVTNSAALTSLSVSNSLTLGTDFIISNNTNNLVSINTLSSPLSIQSLALAPVEIMAGKLKIDTNGDVYIQGNLYVAGQIYSQGITIQKEEDWTGSDPVQATAVITASGSAEFKEITSDKLVIASAEIATDSAQLVDGRITTNATTGSAIIPSGRKEIEILSPAITENTLIYITPTSDTKNYVLYIKAKEEGRAVVGFNRALDIDVSFNWWVVETRR